MLVPSERVSPAATGAWSTTRRGMDSSSPSATATTSRRVSVQAAGETRPRSWRTASARMWLACQVARCSAITSTTAAATRPGSTGSRSGAGADSIRATIASTAAAEPSTCSDSVRQSWRCSARERAWCLPPRVDRVASSAIRHSSFGDGSRPWRAWKSADICPSLPVIASARVDHTAARRGSMPASSRTGRLPASGRPRSTKEIPLRLVSRWCSRREL